MRLLLDTHVLLWALTDEDRLSPEARGHIAQGANQVLVSAASTWEMTVKANLGKLRFPDDLTDQLTRARFEALDIRIEHALAVSDLADHHRDPFDRLLVAQARSESLTPVTRDPQIRRYEVDVLVA